MSLGSQGVQCLWGEVEAVGVVISGVDTERRARPQAESGSGWHAKRARGFPLYRTKDD